VHTYLFEVPGERRIFFVLPWKGGTLLGTTEERQALEEPITCSDAERAYLLAAYQHYFPNQCPAVSGSFAGLRPLIRSTADPNRMTREYEVHRDGQVLSVLGGKWTTALSLARRISVMVG
jgi:glycerol-3-phosphate dehydrogenase